MDLIALVAVFAPAILLYAVLLCVHGARVSKNVNTKFAGRRNGLGLNGTVLPRAGHAHLLIQSSAHAFITSINDDHLHTLKLTEAQIEELNTSGMVTAETTSAEDGHSHTVTLTV